MASKTKTIIFNSPGPGYFHVPNDFQSLISVEAIGGGSASIKEFISSVNSTLTNAGGGGAYAISNTINGLVPGAPVWYNVGIGGTHAVPAGGNSWINTSSATQPTDPSIGLMAAGSFLIQPTYLQNGRVSVIPGGQSNACVYSSLTGIAYSGGNGGNSNIYGYGPAGGGGAAGPNGPGGAGGATGYQGSPATYEAAGGGGGADNGIAGNGGSAIGYLGGRGGNSFVGGTTSGGMGANHVTGSNATVSSNGSGGGGGALYTAGATTAYAASDGSMEIWWNGSIYPDMTGNGTYVGPGGGGGGAPTVALGTSYYGGNGGLYGGGGGSGNSFAGSGLIVFTYQPIIYNVDVTHGITIEGGISFNF